VAADAPVPHRTTARQHRSTGPISTFCARSTLSTANIFTTANILRHVTASGFTVKAGVVVVTHGQLAAELLNAAEMIVGDLPHFAAVSIGWHEDVEGAREEIGRAIARVREKAGTAEQPAGVLVLTDMFGGTPANLAVTFLDTNSVEVVTGLNLAMLMKLARPLKEIDLLTLAREIAEQGRNAIWVASDLIRGEKS
jgi:PTS system mannose-specific IIA component